MHRFPHPLRRRQPRTEVERSRQTPRGVPVPSGTKQCSPPREGWECVPVEHQAPQGRHMALQTKIVSALRTNATCKARHRW
jgi:hypothetical protein